MAKTKKLQNNEDLMRDLMRYSPHGAICQVLIITALEQYCERVSKADPKGFDSPMMNGKAWVGCAADIKQRIDAFYGRHDTPQATPRLDGKNAAG